MTRHRDAVGTTVRVLPVRAYLVRAAVVSGVIGLFVGSLLGVLVSWLAGAAVQWMLQLSFTTGVDTQLLPFGDRFATLETLRDRWFLVIPLTALGVAMLGCLVGLLAGVLLAAIDRWLGPPTYVLVEPSDLDREPIYKGRARLSPAKSGEYLAKPGEYIPGV